MRRRLDAAIGRWALLLIPAGICTLLIAPMAFTERTFAPDWTDHVWLVWEQQQNISDFGVPTYFLQTTTLGAYYPLYAFYGGALYAVAGTLSLGIGTVNSVVAVYLGSFVVAFAGWTWLAMQAGLRGWVAYLPGAVAVTCPYAVTVAYGRGDLAETVAVSVIPLVVASGLSLIRSDRLRAPAVAAYIGGVAVLTGTHTLTLLWGTTFLLALALIAASCWFGLVRERARRVAQLAALSVLGALINAWYLVPLAAYSGNTAIGQSPRALEQTSFTDPGELFSPLRSTAQEPGLAADVQAQLPVLALLCVLVFGALAWRGLSHQRRLLAAGLGGLLGLVLLLLLAPSLIEDLPRFWRFIQFPYRLVSYADLIIVGLLVLVLSGLRSRPRAFRIAGSTVAVVAVLGSGQALAQALAVPSWLTIDDRTTPHDRSAAFPSLDRAPLAWYAIGDFADASAPLLEPTLPGRLAAPVSTERRLTYDVEYPAGKGGTVETNVTAGTYLVDVDGAEAVGRTDDGQLVLSLPPSEAPRTVSFSPKRSIPIVAAQALSVAALIGAVALVIGLAARNRSGSRHGHTERAPAHP
jgi:hypothetical protein